jgi:hypothetical protein
MLYVQEMKSHTCRSPVSFLQIMVSFRSSLLSCLLATTSYAFAVKPIAQSPAFTRSNGASATRVPVNLSMSGGSQTVPDLKVHRNAQKWRIKNYLSYLTFVSSFLSNHLLGSCCHL